MKQLLTFVFALFISATTFAQGTITGKLVDADNGEALISASVVVEGTTIGALSDYDGNFTLSDIPSGSQTIIITYVGYATTKQTVEVKDGGSTDLETIEVSSSAIGLQEITVSAGIATSRKTPVAVSTISGEQIEVKLGNQEFPEILKSTPSIYTTKQGGGFGDARINVRGFSQENVALLINGISVSGMEDNKVYWSNWAGLGDVTRTIQVQRGLGASRLAISSVGGTINIITKTTDQEKGGSVSHSIGNNGFQKTGLTLSTGRTDNGWAFTFSGSRTTGDGYIKGTYADAWSYFGSIAKEIGSNQQLLFTLFGAPQRHGQRDFPHSISDQRDVYGTQWNDDIGIYQGELFHIRENFYHKPQASLNHIWDINDKSSLVTAVYASTGRGGGTGDLGGTEGREREFRQGRNEYGEFEFDAIRNYNTSFNNDFPVYDADTNTISDNIGYFSREDGSYARGGMIKRASMNEHQWYGLLSTYNQQLTDNLNLNAGIDLRFYTGSHYRKTIDLLGLDYWFDDDNVNQQDDVILITDSDGNLVEQTGNLVRPTNNADRLWGSVPDDQKIDYYNDEDINWYGLFAQLEYTNDDLSAFVSGALNNTQMRRYDFFNKTPQEGQVTDWLSFMGGNAKLGVNYNIDEANNVFFNTGFVSRTPYFDALFPTFNNDEPNTSAVNEKVLAAEVGYGYKSRGFAANFNGYYTNWSDKTEFLSNRDGNGELFFASVQGVDAVHMGLELDFRARLSSNLELTGFAGLNDWEWKNNPTGVVTDDAQNTLGEVTYFIDGLKVGDAAQTTVGLGANWTIIQGLSLSANWFYFDRLYASYDPSDRDDEDLAGIQALQLPSYSLVDAGLVWNFKFAGLDARMNANVNNLFNTVYVAEAFDRYRPDTTPEQLLEDTRGWFGFGRTWNTGVKVFF